MARIEGEQFLRTLWGDQEGIAELAFGRPSPKDRTKTGAFWGRPYAYPGDLQKYLSAARRDAGKLNLYYGVCLRRERWPRTGPDGKTQKRGTIDNALSTTCLWADIDFKTTPKDRAYELVKKFPLKPSIGVFSGGGIQPLWLLKEPATGVELEQATKINVGISKLVGGDSTQDMARVLRLPGTPNIKYDPPEQAEVVVWRPELAYTLDDFEAFAMGVELPTQRVIEVSVPEETPDVDVDDLRVSEMARRVIREGLTAYVDFRRSTDSSDKFKGRRLSRSEADAWVITQLIGADHSDETIFAVFRDPENKIGEKYRERRDGEAYLQTTIREMRRFAEDHPKTSTTSAARRVSSKLDTAFGDYDGGDDDGGGGQGGGGPFEVVRLIRYRQEPPTYEVVIQMGGTEFATKCTLNRIYHFEEFKKHFFAQHHRFLPTTKQGRWQRLVERATVEERDVEREEGTFDGRLEAALDELFESAVSEDGAEVAVQHMPIRCDDGTEVFKTAVLLKFLRAQQIEADREKVIHHLKTLGYDNTTRRVGSTKKVCRVWAKMGTNGVAEPEPDVTTDPQGKLFPAEPEVPDDF